MNQSLIEVLVSPTGETSVQTKGYTGTACRAASAFLEQALGVRSTEKLTGEFYAQASTRQVQEGRTG